jgi:hypothetical protein
MMAEGVYWEVLEKEYHQTYQIHTMCRMKIHHF